MMVRHFAHLKVHRNRARMRAGQKVSALVSRVSAAVKRAVGRKNLPDPALPLTIPPGVAGCNVCGYVASAGHPRLCPGCGRNQRQRTFKQLFLERLRPEVFGSGPLNDGLLLSPGEVERALLFPRLRRHVISSLYQSYNGVGPFVRADVRDLAPFGGESFDYVQACNVLDYIPEMEQALRAIHRVLRPGGMFVFLIPEGNLFPGGEPVSVSVHPSVTGNYWPDPTAVPLVRLGRQTLSDLLQQAGFRPEQIPLVDSLSRKTCTWWLCRRG
jgi:SAM-dependent methyltransferase